MRPRRALWVAVASVVFGVTFAACTDLAGLSGAKDGADATTDAGADVLDASGPEAASDASDAFAAGEDAESRDDASSKVDASGCTTCDCDNDSFKNGTLGCGDSGAMLDCDDLDPLIRPGQSFVLEPWTSNHLPVGDWDCNGAVVKQFAYGFTCSGFNPGCSAMVGFMGDPACGELADYFKCAPSGINCVATKIDTRRQGCR